MNPPKKSIDVIQEPSSTFKGPDGRGVSSEFNKGMYGEVHPETPSKILNL
jgi:hypothetical protein